MMKKIAIGAFIVSALASLAQGEGTHGMQALFNAMTVWAICGILEREA